MPTQPQDPRTQGRRPPQHDLPQETPGAEAAMRVKPDHGEATYVGSGRLRGRAALVTGGDSGIGRAVSLAFAREGADVAVAYLGGVEEEDALATRRLVEEAGRRCVLLPGDLADAAHCAQLVDRTADAFGHLDVVVNNAAFQGKAIESIEDLDVDRIERVFRVNVMAMFHVVRRALPRMRAGGAIVNTASIQTYKPNESILDYATTKGAIVTFTKGLALETIKRGIRTNCVAPGPVWTPLVVQSYGKEKIAAFGEESPMQRPAQPAELAPAYVFLASNESSFVNGEVIGVTGGMPLG
jgi:NAD(P)-dependent dehydrogenase (short-subunit alcohol dehydrogenase family)